MTTKRACKATTKAGKPCRAKPLHDQDVCLAHADETTRTKMNFQQGPRPGRPRNPTPTEILRERIEAQIDRYLKPIEDALTAEGAIAVGGQGPNAHVEFFADHRTRLAAVAQAFDRVYGRPKQTTELSGPDGGPMVLDAPIDAGARSAEALRVLQERVQIPVVSGNGSSRNGHH